MGIKCDEERIRTLRRAIRCLKRGVFPSASIDEFTFGREVELSSIGQQLDAAISGLSRHVFVEGTYGLGKSHMLKAIEAMALRRGFAVAWVTLDGQNHACNHPTRYFHSLLESLRVPDSPTRGLASLVREWLRSEKRDSMISWAASATSSWLSFLVTQHSRNLNTLEDFPYLGALLESRDIARRNGKQWFGTVSERIAAVSGLVRAAGFSGVVYLFDELETVATLLSLITQRLLSYEFLNLLIDGRRHTNCMFAFAATPDFSLRLTMDANETWQYASQYPGGCRFMQKWKEASVDRMQVRQLKPSDVLALCRHLIAIHQQAFNWTADGCFSDGFVESFVSEANRMSMGPRETVKALAHFLEIAEQHREVNIRRLLFDKLP